jgi:DNA repair protein RecO (recombination protein O)
MELKLNALMLRAVDYKDNDKILTLLSPELGKITAGIKGVKKANAKLRFAAQPFCFAEYVLAKKGDMYTVIGATETESFYDLRLDIGKLYAASAVCETANALAYEGEEGGVLFSPAVTALSKMCQGEESFTLIQFLLTALSVSGYGINTDTCVECGADLSHSQTMRFDMQTGAFTCMDCSTGAGASLTTFHTLRAAAGKSYDKSCLSADGEKRALRLLREYLTYKTDYKFLSLSEYIRLI